MAFFKFTARILQNKTAYGYDVSGEIYQGSGPMAQQEQTNIEDTAQPQNHHETPRNTSNMAQDSEAQEDFPEELGRRSPIQHYLPVRQK
jgi:hypothetical protein